MHYKYKVHMFFCLCLIFLFQNIVCAQDANEKVTEEVEIEPPAAMGLSEEDKNKEEALIEDEEDDDEESEYEKTSRLKQEKLIADTKKNNQNSSAYNQRNIDEVSWKKAKVEIPINYEDAEKKLQQQQEAIIKKKGNDARMTDQDFTPQMQMPNLNFLSGFSAIAQILIYAVIALVIGIIIYLLFQSSFLQKANRSLQQNYTWEDVAHFDEWETALKDAIAQNNYRLATRILFLQSLQKMHQNNLIQFQKDYTNANYLNKIAPTVFFAPFARLTNNFEKIWYGHYPINANQFSKLQSQFIQFQNTL